jgi:hypothetical protein
MRPQQHLYYDSLLHGCTSLGTYIYKRLGEDALLEAMTGALRYFTDLAVTLRKTVTDAAGGGEEGLKAYIELMADLWRGHFGRWTIEEDDEKFTFTHDPCGSGGRLVDMGAYEGPYAYAKIKNASPMTWGEADVPLYCLHCAIANEILPLTVSGEGSQIWVHDTPCPKKPGDKCVHFIYKDPKMIPDRFYEKIGVPRTKRRMEVF